MKKITVYYTVRKNKSEWTESMTVEANNLRDAKVMVLNSVEQFCNYHPFHMCNKLEGRQLKRERTYQPIEGIDEILGRIHRDEANRKQFIGMYCADCPNRKPTHRGKPFPCRRHFCQVGDNVKDFYKRFGKRV